MNSYLKRSFDIVVSILALLIFFIPMILISLLIKLDSKGKIFFIQDRIGKDFRKFRLLKFRTMADSEHAKSGLFEPGNTKRVTKIGKILRKYKLDELPQLINVLKGDMSLVGPRPEVEEWTKVYPEKWKVVLSVKPGITDYASILFRNEEELLKNSPSPKETYEKEILPKKLSINMDYVIKNNLITDIKILFLTVYKLLKK
ncbi:MAG: sugar transferase [Thermaurantimonas sp.]|uniref:sugar transferase n=1 Tax=Thermaurantimonas sp. TaxID=2681568 RepID=UPI00391A274E